MWPRLICRGKRNGLVRLTGTKLNFNVAATDLPRKAPGEPGGGAGRLDFNVAATDLPRKAR